MQGALRISAQQAMPNMASHVKGNNPILVCFLVAYIPVQSRPAVRVLISRLSAQFLFSHVKAFYSSFILEQSMPPRCGEDVLLFSLPF